MSLKSIKKLNTVQLFDLQKAIIDELIRKVQIEYDNKKYPTKNPHDKLQCKICGGRYTRQKKSSHERTKKHQESLEQIYDRATEIFE